MWVLDLWVDVCTLFGYLCLGGTVVVLLAFYGLLAIRRINEDPEQKPWRLAWVAAALAVGGAAGLLSYLSLRGVPLPW
jgi:hypothetical protein